MKKFALTLMILLSFTFGYSQTYQTAIGVKGLGGGHYGGGGINLKHFIAGPNALELTVGGGNRHLNAQLLYEWQHSTDLAEGLDWYVGLGGTVGTWRNGYYHPVHDDYYYKRGLYLDVNAVIGLDWNLEPVIDIPLGLAVDVGPSIGLINSRLWGWGGAFAIRYILK